jgi:16S rRNA (guanine966-N2)-methyltransferase
MLVSDGLLGDPDAAGVRVLDLYAGTGALAFEALSRGAASAVLIEHGRDAVAVIRENARSLDATDRVEIVPTKVDRSLARLEAAGSTFGVVFADPPYADVREGAFAAVLASAARLVAPGGAFVLEHASTDAPPAVPGLVLDRTRAYGDTTLSVYRREALE